MRILAHSTRNFASLSQYVLALATARDVYNASYATASNRQQQRPLSSPNEIHRMGAHVRYSSVIFEHKKFLVAFHDRAG
jgi:hypothetical protein